MKRHLRFFTSLFLFLLLFLLCIVNWRLYYDPEFKIVDGDTVNYDALCQLRHLRDAIEDNAGNEMQHIYPEGYVFFNTLYGLSWCDMAESLDKNSILFQEAHVEVQRAFNNVNTRGRVIFDETLPLPYGAFYNGWMTYLLGKKLGLEPTDKRDPAEVRLFKTQCERIESAIIKQTYPETYYGQSWPADVVLCIAALAKHDRLYHEKYKATIDSWWTRANKNTDDMGLIPHKVHSVTGHAIESARGSSQSLIQCFLPEIVKGNHDYDTYRKTFAASRFGLPGVFEYPNNIDGTGDIDSGPVVLGIGGAATIVGMRAAKVNGDFNEYVGLRNSIEGLTFPLRIDGRKKYLFGRLPIVDVFITWAQGPYTTSDLKRNVGSQWRIEFQLWSAGIGIILLVALLLMWKKKKRNL